MIYQGKECLKVEAWQLSDTLSAVMILIIDIADHSDIERASE
jgi:hypothetical protein